MYCVGVHWHGQIIDSLGVWRKLAISESGLTHQRLQIYQTTCHLSIPTHPTYTWLRKGLFSHEASRAYSPCQIQTQIYQTVYRQFAIQLTPFKRAGHQTKTSTALDILLRDLC